MSETDYNSILKRLFPREDGEPPLKYRKGICAGVGSGVIDVTLSGVIIPDVPIHGTASINDEVHLLTDALGRMLAIGECGGGGGGCGSCNLGDLLNVDTTGQDEGDMLWYDGTEWVLVGGSKTAGNVPTVQGDGSVEWAPQAGGGGGGALLGSAVDVSNRSYTANNTWETIANTTVTFTAPASRPLIVIATVEVRGFTANWVRFGHRLIIDGTATTGYAPDEWLQGQDQNAVNSHWWDITVHFIVDALTAGSHTIALQTYDANSSLDREYRRTAVSVMH